MEKFLIFHTRYKDVQVGYFEQQNLVEINTIDSIMANKCLLVTIDTLLKKFALSLKDFSFLGAHIGPAPYTTLRVILATLNSLNYSVGTPLVGVNGLTSFLNHLNKSVTNVILLNAFGHDLYYGISDIRYPEYNLGCKSFGILLNEIAHDIPGIINFFGNGSYMYKKEIEQIFGSRASINSDKQIVPIEFLGQEALKQWHNKKIESELFPIYLK